MKPEGRLLDQIKSLVGIFRSVIELSLDPVQARHDQKAGHISRKEKCRIRVGKGDLHLRVMPEDHSGRVITVFFEIFINDQLIPVHIGIVEPFVLSGILPVVRKMHLDQRIILVKLYRIILAPAHAV